MDVDGVARRAASPRTAKLWRPDASTLASSRRGKPAGDGGKKARSPGRPQRKPLKPFARGMPGETGVTVVTMLVCFLFSHARPRALSGRPAFPAPF